MFHAVTTQERADARLLNFLVFGDDWFIQRQFERRDGRFYMRAKKRLA